MNEQNQAENKDSTSTPSNGATEQTRSLIIAEFPRIQDSVERAEVKYGDRTESLPISATERVSIDAYFFQSATNFRLKKIKTAIAGLKKAGVKQTNGSDIDSVWFNANVRDPFHKVLRFAAKQSLETGKPVSLAFTRRTVKATGLQIVTAKHAFEHEVPGPGTAKAIPDAVVKKAEKQSKNRANRQNRKSKRISPLPNPVIAPVPTPTPEPAPAAA